MTELALTWALVAGTTSVAGVGNDGGAAGLKEILHAAERWVEREGAAALRSLKRDG